MLSELYAGMYKEASYSSQALLRIKLGVDNGGILLLGASGEGKVLPGKVWLVSMSQKAFLSLEST